MNKGMKQIRENIWQVTHTDLGLADYKGYFKVEGLGEIMLDQADLRYIEEMNAAGYEPTFHVSRSPALNNAFVVVGRQKIA